MQELAPRAEVVELPERADHYAGPARPALHHLERGLFEAGGEQRAPNGAVRLLEAGGERAEAELVGAEVLELMRDGVAPEEIAVLVRGVGSAALFAQVLGAYGIPVGYSRRVPLGAHPARRRACSPAPGRRSPAAAPPTCWRGCGPRAWRGAPDGGGRARRGGAPPRGRGRPRGRGALGAGARSRGSTRWRTPRREGAEALLAALVAEADALWAAPHVRRADVLDDAERDEARVAAELRAAAGELRGLAATDPALLGGPEDVLETLGAVEVRQGDATEGVLLADPLEIRARRFRAVFVCGLQDAEFPRRPVPEPFLDDDARRGLAAAAGPAAAAARGRARPRALAVLRLRLAPAGGAVPVLALLRRGGRAAGRLAVPRRRAVAVHRPAVGGARAPAARRGDVVAARGADAARAAARPGRGALGARPAAAARAGQRAGARRSSPRGARRARASSRRSPPAGCAGSSRACCRRAAWRPTPSR